MFGFSLLTCRCLGAVSGIQKHDNMLHKGRQPLLGWMFDLAQELASIAQQHSRVYQLGSVFTPDVALINFYLVQLSRKKSHVFPLKFFKHMR
jgi:hypothetical protein